MSTALQQVAGRLKVSDDELQKIVMFTIMPDKGKNVTPEQFISFMAVANEYRLNPLTKEIYAFPAKGGGIQPIVSIDGWLRIINSHPDFNGMTFEDCRSEGGELTSITCSIYRKNVEHPIQVTEYMAECKGTSEPWKKWPARMLRHKTAIQAGRYAFGLSGIIDPDEADRYRETGSIDAVEVTEVVGDGTMPVERFNNAFDKFEADILGQKRTATEMIAFIESKGFLLSDSQKESLRKVEEGMAA